MAVHTSLFNMVMISIIINHTLQSMIKEAIGTLIHLYEWSVIARVIASAIRLYEYK